MGEAERQWGGGSGELREPSRWGGEQSSPQEEGMCPDSGLLT